MTKEQLYSLWSENLRALCSQIELNKKIIQIKIGESEYHQKNLDAEIKVLMLNYIFLLASWFDCSINLIINENSKEGFLGKEIEEIKNKPLALQWKICFNLVICRKYNLHYKSEILDYSNLIKDTVKKERYKKTLELIKNIENIIIMRNKIAHGQWEHAFNSKKTHLSSIFDDFFKKYDNIQKLDILLRIFENIYLLIKNAVISLRTFERDFDKILTQIVLAEKRIHNSDYKKYKQKFYMKEKFCSEAKKIHRTKFK